MAAGPGVSGPPFVGRPVRRREDERVLRGEARYLDDIELPGLAHMAFVRSPHAHARITSVRTPDPGGGVLAVITAADLGGRVRPFPKMALEDVQIAGEQHPVLPDAEVRYAGQPVAGVVAETRALAEDAAELVEIDYDPLEAVVDPRASADALMRWSRSGGDVEAAFARAAHVIGGRYGMPRVTSVAIEPRGAIAQDDPGAGVLTVWCSAQDPHRPLAQLSHILGRPDDTIRVLVPDVGGAFGTKGNVAPEVAVLAVAAADLGRPLKWAEDRLENFLTSQQGRGMEADVELALDDDGRILAVRARIVADLGAYLLPATHIPPHTAGMLIGGCYDIPAAAVEVVGARTHKVPAGPYRGAGRPEGNYFVECAVEDAARALGVDAVALRRRNLVRRFPHPTPLGWTYDSGDYERCLDLALEHVRPERRADDRAVIGTGVGLYVERSGGVFESADVAVEPSGRVVVRSSTSPHGQGHETTFAQIAADRLGLALDDIVLRFGDSAVVPRGTGTFGSRSLVMGGSALVRAADEVAAKARAIAAHLLGGAPGDVEREDGDFVLRDGRIAFRDVASAAYQPPRLPAGMEPGLRASATFSSDIVFSSGAHAAVVEIERATGRLRILRMAAVDDAGTLVNPLLAHGQVIGGIVQGLGQCLTEEVVHDEAGQLRSASLLDYSLLTAAEVPPLSIVDVQTPSPLNPLGAKGVGEGGATGALPAVTNAVADALGRHVDPPFTAGRLWRALQEAAR
ncbi:MAG: aerobic carbon-monoxide dehydrogenase large subunit [Solirubrobacteraceae bacterium]|nr:aerobic carbon-monoxide dehydrogenase large subunit [Solirubrobacteraceae bacterium]